MPLYNVLLIKLHVFLFFKAILSVLLMELLTVLCMSIQDPSALKGEYASMIGFEIYFGWIGSWSYSFFNQTNYYLCFQTWKETTKSYYIGTLTFWIWGKMCVNIYVPFSQWKTLLSWEKLTTELSSYLFETNKY